MAIEKIPDQSGDVEVRLRIMPWLHDEVMQYGRENGIRGTNERYCLGLTHFFRIISRLPQFEGFNAAICGVDVQMERDIQIGMRRSGMSREAVIAHCLRDGLKRNEAEEWMGLEAAQELERRRA